MNRQLCPISLNHVEKILSKVIDYEQLGKETNCRFTAIGFVMSIDASNVVLFDGTGTVSFSLDESLDNTKVNDVLRIHFLISKSLEVRIIFTEHITCGEEMLVHLVEEILVSKQEKSESEELQGGEGFEDLFSGIGGMK